MEMSNDPKSDLIHAILAMDSYNRGYGAGISDLTESGQIGSFVIGENSNQDGWFTAGFYALAYRNTDTRDFRGQRDCRGNSGRVIPGTVYPFDLSARPCHTSRMARLPRIVLPGIPHHVTQRGNRRLPVFFNDEDRSLYLELLAEAAKASGTRCLAWCLMDNHVHLVLVPEHADGLRAALGEAHRRYTRHVNFREGWRGHLFQGRFASYPMDDAHLMAAVRYVELNPVAAGVVAAAEDWPWSSARSHIAGKRVKVDPLTDVGALGKHVPRWRAALKRGFEAGVEDEAGAAVAEAIEARLRTGRPLADPEWIAAMEQASGRRLAAQKPGRKRKSEDEE